MSAHPLPQERPLQAHAYHYSLLIQWEPIDSIYVVTVPEIGGRTHGSTYQEAVTQAEEMIESYIDAFQDERALPAPQVLVLDAAEGD